MARTKAEPESPTPPVILPPVKTNREPAPPPPTWDERLIDALSPWWVELSGGGLVLVAILTLLGLSGLSRGGLLGIWVQWNRELVGWGAYPLWLSLAAAGLYIALRQIIRPYPVTPLQVVGLEMILVTSLPLTYIFSQATRLDALNGRGGGLLGWALAAPLVDFFGPIITTLLHLSLLAWGFALLVKFGWDDLLAALRRFSIFLQTWAEQIDVVESGAPRAMRPRVARSQPSPEPISDTTPILVDASAKPTPNSGRDPRLPSLDLLHEGVTYQSPVEEIERKKQVIVQTLLDFGLPAEITDVRQGPSITQFGVLPGYVERPGPEGDMKQAKVRVGQIASLNKDLSLALQVPRLRIEAPVPGRGIVGIEVPNDETGIVRLRSLLETDPFQRGKSTTLVALGADVSGGPVITELTKLPHILIAGTTGSGKSVCLNATIACLVCNNTPEQLKLVMIDPKKVELIRFNGLPHLLGKVEVEAERALGVLKWLTAEMDRRYQAFAVVGARNLVTYNHKIARHPNVQLLPIIAVIIDELADLMGLYPGEVEPALCRLAQMARATGIHLVVATQRPSTDVITGLIKANFPARISFAVASGTDSRVILDTVGAENLLGRGDMLFLSPDASAPMRVQGCFLDDSEIDDLVEHWRHVMPPVPTPEAPWENLIERQNFVDERDEMLEQAIELVQKYDMISTSMLQRRLRVGYPRAARLMEVLHEMGLVEDPKQGGRTRRSYTQEGDDPIGQALSGGDEDE
ncbi:MAG: DNA translocase FtsK [Chloroflexi bacterium]|nr:DNA translocase FtsK [Chloroflexota bacterium]MBP8054861.1 DNA translocase FtsK [Chloroflexota bacterium]